MKPINCLILLIIQASFVQAQDNFPFTVRGKIDTVPNAMYELYFTKDGQHFVDTIYLDANSEFTYTGYISEPSRLFFFIENTYDKRLVRQYTAYNFWVEPHAKIDFFGHKKLREMDVEGSAMEVVDTEFRKQLDSLEKFKGDIYDDKLTMLYKNSIIKNQDNYYALWLLYVGLKQMYIDDTYASEICKSLKEDLKNTYLGRDVGTMVQLKVGAKFPNFSLPDTGGTMVDLEGYKGKYVFVDFWASWCGPCRKENPIIKKAYALFRPKGLEIIGVSLDNNRDKWIGAIHQDGMDWVQVSDLNGVKSDLTKKYMINEIPRSFLLDPKGVIVAKDLRGEELLEFLEKEME